jgi:fatty-acyl-CoA synthase
MKGAPAIPPKYLTLIEMLDAAAQSELGLVFVNRKEQDHDVPFARIREQALSVLPIDGGYFAK